MYAVGVDGCRAGWISASGNETSVAFDLHETLEELAARHSAACIAVDIPIGLAENEPRRCDLEARKLLVERRSSVFPAPDRRVLEAYEKEDLTYAETNALSKHLTGKGISAQAYNIFDKIAEADALITPESQERICEIHPELSFLALAERPMRHPKKKPEGFAERLELLKTTFPNLAVESRREVRELCPCAAPDDVLDALAALSSGLRVSRGEALRLPATPHLDRRGLRMEILY